MAYINGKKICLFGVICTVGDTPSIENDTYVRNDILYVVAPLATVNIENDILCVEGASIAANIENDILYAAAG